LQSSKKTSEPNIERNTMQNNSISIPYDHPGASNQSSCSTAQAWAKAPRDPKPEEKAALIARIKQMLIEQDAVLVAHYYVNADLQDLAEATGGYVSDSLALWARQRKFLTRKKEF
jgi:quinolinate synthase